MKFSGRYNFPSLDMQDLRLCKHMVKLIIAMLELDKKRAVR